jgi:SAM-dependent methyltransferase
MTDFYDNPLIINNFNTILNGRWHTGLNCHKYGQIEMEELVIQHLNIQKTDRVLDFGSGTGLTSIDIHLMTGCELIGVNISPQQIAMSNILRDQFGLDQEKIKFVLTIFDQPLPFPDNYFDKIIFFESICHVNDKNLLFREFYRILKPDGIFGGQDWIGVGLGQSNQAICQAYAIPSLFSLVQWNDCLKKSEFKVVWSQDLQTSYNLQSSFQIDYFTKLTVFGLITYVLSYLISMLRIRWKYPRLQIEYPRKIGLDEIMIDQNRFKVLDDGFRDRSFSVGLIIAKK